MRTYVIHVDFVKGCRADTAEEVVEAQDLTTAAAIASQRIFQRLGDVTIERAYPLTRDWLKRLSMDDFADRYVWRRGIAVAIAN